MLASGSADEGASVTLNLSLNAASGSLPSALQWTLSYAPGDIVSVSTSTGSALTAAGKTVTCNTTSGSIVCLATGMNANSIGSGVVATVTATLAPVTSSGSIPVGIVDAMGALPDGSAATVSGTGGTITVQNWVPTTVTLSSLTCSPLAVITPGTSGCTVTLSGPAPSTGSTVALTSNNTAVSIPSSVKVSSGSATTAFTASSASVSTTQTVILTASLNGSSAQAALTLQPPGLVSGLVAAYGFGEDTGSTVSDSSGNGYTGQIQGATWTTDGKYGSALSFNGASSYVDLGTPPLLSTTGSMSWSAWVMATGNPPDDGQIIAQSDDSDGWQLKTSPDTGPRTFGIGLSPNSNSRTQRYSKTVVALNTWYYVTGVYDAAAKTLDIYVNGVLDDGVLNGTVPSSQSVASVNTNIGRRSGGYYFNGVIDEVRVYNEALTAAQIQSDMNTPISGGGGGNPPGVTSLRCNPNSISSGSTSSCTVTLSQAAPGGGASVALSSNNDTALSVPASVTVASGDSSANFTATAGTVTTTQTVTITASLNGTSANSSITIVAPVAVVVSALQCNPNSVLSGSTSACAVTLSQAAPGGGASVALSSNNNTALTVPASVTVASGDSSANFTATAGTVATTQTVTVTASLNGKSVSASLSVQPPTVVPGLISAYSFNEDSGSTIADSSVNGNTGTIHGADWTTKGKFGSALSFNGNGDYVDLGQPESLQTSGSMSWSAWVMATANPPDDGQIVAQSDDDNGWQFKTSPDTGPRTFAVAISPNGSPHTQRYSKTVPALFTWYYVAGVYNAATTTLDIYVNGVLDDGVLSGTVPASQSVPNINASIGQRSGGYYFDGVIDELRIYNVALTAAQIQSDMSTPLGLPTGIMTPATPLVSTLRPEAVTAPSESKPAPASPAAFSSLSCVPGTVSAGGQATCELRTNSSATPAGIQLSTSSLQVRVPESILTRPNQSSLTFLVSVDPAARQQSVVVTAMAGGAMVQDALLVTPSSAPVLQAPAKQLARWGELARFNVHAVDPAALPIQLKAHGMPAGASFDSESDHFEWVPNASQAGSYRVAFTATNSARQSSTAEVILEVDSGKPGLTASDQLSCSPGAIAAVSGKWLADSMSTLSDPSGKTTNLGGTRVNVNGVYAPLLFAAADQVKFLCPAQHSDTPLSVTVENRSAISNVVSIPMRPASPAILSLSFADNPDLVMPRNFLMSAHPAQPGDHIVVWATGLGSAAESGNLLVKIGDTFAGSESVQTVPGYAGVYGIRVRVPATVSFGDSVPVQLQLAMPGEQQFHSNSVTAAIEPVRE